MRDLESLIRDQEVDPSNFSTQSIGWLGKESNRSNRSSLILSRKMVSKSINELNNSKNI